MDFAQRAQPPAFALRMSAERSGKFQRERDNEHAAHYDLEMHDEHHDSSECAVFVVCVICFGRYDMNIVTDRHCSWGYR